MKKLTRREFLTSELNMDRIYAIHIENKQGRNKVWFLAQMEDSQDYKIKQAIDSEGYEFHSGDIEKLKNLQECVNRLDQYNAMYILWHCDDNGVPYNEEDQEYDTPYDRFLSLINPVIRDKKVYYDIIMATNEELADMIDLLAEGDYVIVLSK